MSKENNSIFTDEEQEILKMTKDIRVNAVKHITKSGIPDKVGEQRILNELLNSLDDMVQKSAANRLKHEENNNKEAMLDSVAAALMSISAKKLPAVDRVIEGGDEIIPEDIVEGEIDVNPTPLNPDDFIPSDAE